MKYVVLSFDDGKSDFLVNALPILNKYRIPATINVITDAVDQRDFSEGKISLSSSMSWNELKLCAEQNIEIACHSASHTNSLPDIIRGAKRLTSAFPSATSVGFASPRSHICKDNIQEYQELISSGCISYIRSGNQLRRDGLFHAFLYLLYTYTKWSWVFSLYNRRNIITLEKKEKSFFFPSITCNKDNSMKQLESFIRNMPDNTACVIMLHSILSEKDPGYKENKWSNTTVDFENLCAALKNSDTIQTITNNDLFLLLQHE